MMEEINGQKPIHSINIKRSGIQLHMNFKTNSTDEKKLREDAINLLGRYIEIFSKLKLGDFI